MLMCFPCCLFEFIEDAKIQILYWPAYSDGNYFSLEWGQRILGVLLVSTLPKQSSNDVNEANESSYT